MAEERGEGSGEQGFEADRLGGRDIRRQQWERSPRKREPRVTVETSSEELEVVCNRDERARSDEEQQPEARPERDADADRSGAGERHSREADQRSTPDARLQR